MAPISLLPSFTLRRAARRCGAMAGSVAAVLALTGCGGSTTLNGAGASFPASIYQRWFQELAGQGVRVNYQSVGSGAGVRQFHAGTVDFGATDEELQEKKGEFTAGAAGKRGAVNAPADNQQVVFALSEPGDISFHGW